MPTTRPAPSPGPGPAPTDGPTGLPAGLPVDHHTLPAHEVVLLLRTDTVHGLSLLEAVARARRLGPNRLPAARREHPVVGFLRQLAGPLVLVLLAAGVAAALLGEVVDASVIAAVVLVNAVVGFVQEQRAQRALDALQAMVEVRATVVRGGHAVEVPAEELVPGDVVLLAEGDKVPADLRLVAVDELAVDESALTGESLPVAKAPLRLPAPALLADRTNMAWSGTFVTRGSGRGVVVAHGGDTELGRVHRLVAGVQTLATPLTRALGRFSVVMTVVILTLAALAVVVGLLRGQPLAEVITVAVALAVAAIPEGLPAVVTVTLAVGVTRMARRGAVVRRLPAVETLGSTTTVCTDKTGTLTQNRQTVQVVVTAAGHHRPGSGDGAPEPGGSHEAARQVLLAGVLCNDARPAADGGFIGDPTETALLSALAEDGADDGVAVTDVLRGDERVATVPFSSQRRLMATRHASGAVYVKGAAEAVLTRCATQRGRSGPEPVDVAAWEETVHELSGQGLRVLACARGRAASDDDGDRDGLQEADLDRVGLELLGLLAMADPPRPAAAAAVRACRAAGVRVVMVTGDHAATARSVARQVGLAGDDEPVVVAGTELGRVPDADLPGLVASTDVFARVSPEHKLRLVRALQARGDVVAMTGDGVNDAPALEQADIGVAMGRGGTEVAQEAADMVLTDDDFASIEAAVEEGRGVFDNLVKFLVFALPTNFGQGLVVLLAVLLGTALPMTPVQVLWLNLTTAVLLGLPLAVEAKEPGLMSRPPRLPGSPLVSPRHVRRMLLVSLLLLAGAFGVFELQQALGAGTAEARTAAVNLFVLVEAAYLLGCRSLDRAPWQLGWWTNRWVPAGITAAVGLQLLLTYVPAMNALFGTAPVGALPWLLGLGYALVCFALVDLLRRLDPPGPATDEEPAARRS